MSKKTAQLEALDELIDALQRERRNIADGVISYEQSSGLLEHVNEWLLVDFEETLNDEEASDE